VHTAITVAVRNKPPVVVPAAALRRAGFKRGQVLEVRSTDGVVTIVPKPDGEYTPAERRAIERDVAQSEKEFAAGLGRGPWTAQEFSASMEADIKKLRTAKRKAKSAR
jgi:bifunctional DNA-binding transcriptional regulator/antitoxin component of YhaV-PrlF toxin-antitoxin module